MVLYVKLPILYKNSIQSLKGSCVKKTYGFSILPFVVKDFIKDAKTSVFCPDSAKL